MRILVTGPRLWNRRDILHKAFESVEKRYPRPLPVVIVHGGAGGLDIMADGMAKRRSWSTDPYYPDYVKYASHVAPLMRNQEMVDSGIDLCLAFLMECSIKTCKRPKPHYTHGTTDCMERAERAGIEIRRYYG